MPIEMPSETVMVLNSTLLPPAASTPAQLSRASSSMCMLQGVRFAQVEAMPICGLLEVRIAEADRAQHRARGRLLVPIHHHARERARVGDFLPGHVLPDRSLLFAARAAHAVEAQRPGHRHQKRQRERVFPGARMQRLQSHVGEHAGRRGEAAAQPRER